MTRRVVHHGWKSATAFDTGAHDGTEVHEGRLRFGSATRTRRYVDPHRDGEPVSYEQASWTSPEVVPGFPVTDLIPSWNATTPRGTWLEVELAATMDDGSCTGWYALARWAETDEDVHPTSVPGQADRHASVTVDVLTAREPRTIKGYRIRVNLLRAVGAGAAPTVSLVGVTGSNVAAVPTVARASRCLSVDTVIDVPAYSQQVHRGDFPQWGNGGESWCSPTATSMVLAHWGRGPSPAAYRWVDAGHQDGFVDYAARHVFDHGYCGAGNWSFNTAYAGRFGMTAYVTRLRSLAEAERFVEAGIPLVVSVSFTRDQLDGAGYDTEGHLLTLVGFDQRGHVVSNDPASHSIASNDEVRTVFDRAQFEDAWLERNGGVTYVIHPPDVALPDPPAEANW